MSRIAFVFPGQGAQYVGMGKDFYDTYQSAKDIFKLAGDVTGLDMEKLVFEENEQLNITEYTQIAMLTAELAIWKVLDEKGIRADVCAGLSLGEYGALAVSKVLELPDLFRLIRKRGIFMQEEYPTGGAMAAVMGADVKLVEDTCLETGKETGGIVSVANYNCPGQIVITGEEETVQAAIRNLTAKGVKRCIPLKVSGPFHSALLEGAGEKLLNELENVEIKAPQIPYVSNVTADYVTESCDIRTLLKQQVASPVCFWQSVERMIADGVDTFVEIGPGKTLSSFIKKIDKSVNVMNVDKLEALDKVLTELTA